MQNQLKELIDVARANDLLTAKIHELSLQLLAHNVALSEPRLPRWKRRHALAVSAPTTSYPRAFSPIRTHFDDINGRPILFRVVASRKRRIKVHSKTFLDGGSSRAAAQVRDSSAQLSCFTTIADDDRLRCSVMVPLGDQSAEIGFPGDRQCNDADRFHPGMSIDFLGPPRRPGHRQR